jgi:hypothetical protein
MNHARTMTSHEALAAMPIEAVIVMAFGYKSIPAKARINPSAYSKFHHGSLLAIARLIAERGGVQSRDCFTCGKECSMQYTAARCGLWTPMAWPWRVK